MLAFTNKNFIGNYLKSTVKSLYSYTTFFISDKQYGECLYSVYSGELKTFRIAVFQISLERHNSHYKHILYLLCFIKAITTI